MARHFGEPEQEAGLCQALERRGELRIHLGSRRGSRHRPPVTDTLGDHIRPPPGALRSGDRKGDYFRIAHLKGAEKDCKSRTTRLQAQQGQATTKGDEAHAPRLSVGGPSTCVAGQHMMRVIHIGAGIARSRSSPALEGRGSP